MTRLKMGKTKHPIVYSLIVSSLLKPRIFVDTEYHVTITWLNCIDTQRFLDLDIGHVLAFIDSMFWHRLYRI